MNIEQILSRVQYKIHERLQRDMEISGKKLFEISLCNQFEELFAHAIIDSEGNVYELTVALTEDADPATYLWQVENVADIQCEDKEIVEDDFYIIEREYEMLEILSAGFRTQLAIQDVDVVNIEEYDNGALVTLFMRPPALQKLIEAEEKSGGEDVMGLFEVLVNQVIDSVHKHVNSNFNLNTRIVSGEDLIRLKQILQQFPGAQIGKHYEEFDGQSMYLRSEGIIFTNEETREAFLIQYGKEFGASKTRESMSSQIEYM